MTKLYTSEAEKALQAYLRKHWIEKYGTRQRAADFLCCTLQHLNQVGGGHCWPNDRILEDAGVKVRLLIEFDGKVIERATPNPRIAGGISPKNALINRKRDV